MRLPWLACARLLGMTEPDVVRDWLLNLSSKQASNPAPCRRPPNDIPEAVAARLARSRFLHEGDHRFVVLIEEGARCTQIDTTATMAGQLAHLLAVMPLPSVSLGIIPFGVPRTMWPLEAFCLYNDQHTVIETLTTSISVRQPRARARRVSRVRPRS